MEQLKFIISLKASFCPIPIVTHLLLVRGLVPTQGAHTGSDSPARSGAAHCLQHPLAEGEVEYSRVPINQNTNIDQPDQQCMILK
jgi:hypothetical protein